MSNKKTTALATIANNPLKVVTLLDQKIAEMKKIEDTKWKTSGTISAYGITIDLKTETKLENIIRVIASIQGQEQAFTKAQLSLGVKQAPAFTISGHLVEDWISDAKLRIAINNQAEELETLRKFKEKASEFITKEEKQSALFAEMEEYFKGK